MSITDTLVQRYLCAMPCDTYRLQIVSFRGEDNPADFSAKFEVCSKGEVIKRMKYFKFRNHQGFNIYCRPNTIDYILVNDINRNTLKLVAQFQPCVLMETSPDNFQAFFHLAERPDTELAAKVICGEFALMFDGDYNAANAMQPGRLPGFTNRKPKYADQNGNYPFIKLHGACDRYTTFSPKGGACLADHIYHGIRRSFPENTNTFKGIDRSREDFWIACNMIRKGESDATIYDVLIRREKGWERGRSYVNFTVKNAHRAVMKQ